MLFRSDAGCEPIAVRLYGMRVYDDDRVWTELGKGVVLGGVAERDEPEIHAFGAGDAQIGPLGTAGFLPGGTSKLALGFDPAAAAAEQIAPTIFAIGDERPPTDDDMLKGADRRKLSVNGLAFAEER